ncbi:NlpC/P60 family protein [Streptomyces pseudovenezuelae]|uniref:C40 family peptidase n=1 Tax=Streptomyces pseudovenezuelae TaxID=67350 RepID=UPI0034A0E1E4
MASHRRPKQPGRARVTVLTATAAAAVALASQSANAAPKATKAEVKEKVDRLYEETERATNQYDEAQEKQDKLEKEIGLLQDKVAREQGELNELRSQLGSMASEQYRSGGIDPSLQLFLSADPDDYLDQASTLESLSAQQVESLKRVQAKQRELAQERTEASEKLKNLAVARTTLGEKKKEIQAKLRKAQALLNSLTAAERQEITDAEQRASRSAASRVDLGSEVAASPFGASALSAAASQVGKPYARGGTGPNSYDCSGLTQWAYAQAGVKISRVTYTQVNDGAHIGMSALKPGDLVFFNNTEHVGLYAGNGQVLHAPYPGAYVRYESMSTIGSFQFGVRVVG